ncbi:DUF2982 domain-containing protein [Pseudoalteromonas xiamenensis]
MTKSVNNESVKLRATANQHAVEFMLVGAIAIIVVMLFVLLRPTPISKVEIFIASAGIVAIIIGFFKSQEPYFSVEINCNNLIYWHKFGFWRLPRNNLVEAGIPKSIQGEFELELNAVGIKIKDIDEFLLSLSPRLAAKLLIEQRHIFLQAVKMHCENGNCPEDWLIEDSAYCSPSGKKYSGLLAMFGNRMAHFKLATGYDLMLMETVLDRDIWRFANLLNHWKRDPERVLNQLQQSLLRSK